MRVTIAAVGRMREGPEATLSRDYVNRASVMGRALAVGPMDVVEVDDRRASTTQMQGEALLRQAAGDTLIALDERGDALSSLDFASMLAALRDRGARRVVFAIGGPDGHDDAIRAASARILSLGPMVWPHMLARVMLAEQVYRAVSILSDKPYHRR